MDYSHDIKVKPLYDLQKTFGQNDEFAKYFRVSISVADPACSDMNLNFYLKLKSNLLDLLDFKIF
jgi:hypothetical protein